jgi:hypothetical protein
MSLDNSSLDDSSLALDADSDLSYDVNTGWVQLKSPHALQGDRVISLCWLPVERRGDIFATHGHTLVIGAKTGMITILDFAAMLASVSDTDAS